MIPATPQAIAAVRAVKEGHIWGPLMTMKFLLNHANAALKFEEL